MSPLEILQLIGYSMAAVLPFWLGSMLWRRRRVLSNRERVLLPLAFTMGAWHTSNLALTLHSMLGLADGRWIVLLRAADTVAVASVTLIYSLLLHVHLYLWADARKRPLTRVERIRVYLSYIPALFLLAAVPPLWRGEYAPMFVKLAHFIWPFALWATYVLCLTAATDFLIARQSDSPSERRLMRTLAALFLGVAALILAVYAFGVGQGTALGAYLQTVANLGSLLPSALLAYHIYRYRYLELIVRESLILASFAVVVLIFYLYGIRTFGGWMTARYQLREGAVETLLIVSLALVAAPLRRWLDQRFSRIFEREASLYRDVVTRIGAHAGDRRELPELLSYAEERITTGLNLRRVRLLALRDAGRADVDGDGGKWEVSPAGAEEFGRARGSKRKQKEDEGKRKEEGDGKHAGSHEEGAAERDEWAVRLLGALEAQYWEPLEGESLTRGRGYEIAYALRREERVVGLMLVDAANATLTHDVRAVLEILAGQVAIAIEDSRLVEENVRLERQLAHRERLAALGQMAATVAHEVKNPLSAIKSIAQVMREDSHLPGEYSRDLELIVGETDRLNRSVTQLLSFARNAPPAEAPQRADEVVRKTLALLGAEAASRGVALEFEGWRGAASDGRAELPGAHAAALRDALSNLLLNALQATPAGGRVTVEARDEGERLLISVTDGGGGVPDSLRERIW
ncbi:MAG TPA: histidine kinase dimerization/phospho-acceptor domain-containing protein, partial [Pyrinomonadaceae bacterium]|nr:histidine kinase dimerization/phospho-acceptor domain-containing protein [Pyrinomonadaceae bacterium]